MNASGKSSLMKALGISIFLAQVGCYVPASSMVLQPFQQIATRILNQDNLWAGLSSFAVEVRELRDIFSVSNQNTLVLGDELCAGTESVSATSIVAAGIEHLQTTGAKFVLASHLHDLMKLPIVENPTLQVFHLKVYYDPGHDCLVYDRSLQPGPGNTYYGLEVAKALHMNHSILESAQRYRHILLGSTTTQQASQSAWNSNILRKECELCHHTITKDLEVHHIQQRKDAKQQKNKDGTQNHDARNLVVVCQTCHDAHHRGELQIAPLVDTSHGPQRIQEFPAPVRKETITKETYDEATLQMIQKVCRENPLLHPRLLVVQLKKENVSIDEKSLKKLLKTAPL
jgi:DNA mismatch repair protein MutS